MTAIQLYSGEAWDEFYSVDTHSCDGGLSWQTLKPPYCSEYAPSSLEAFKCLVGSLDTDFVNDVLIDFGSGKGRIVLAAQELPLKRIVGLELQSSLCDMALSNLSSWRGKRACKAVEIICCDAEEYVIPDDGTIFYMYNPFTGAVLQSVMNSIAASVRQIPRRCWLIFNNVRGLENLPRTFPGLRLIRSQTFEHDCVLFQFNP